MGTQRPDFAEFHRTFRDDCLRTVLVIVGDQDSAQELAAEAFARACASWRTLSKHPASAAWVVGTALNLNISRWRHRRREIPVPDPGMLAGRPAAAAAVQDPVDPQIMAAPLRLPARHWQVIALRLILDLDTSGAAQVVPGITPNDAAPIGTGGSPGCRPPTRCPGWPDRSPHHRPPAGDGPWMSPKS